MSKKPHIPPSPPRWASRLLEWYCKPSLYEDLQGDLLEYFDRNVEKRGAAYAKLIYMVDVVKFIRSYTVQKPQIFTRMNQLVMFRNYFKTSVRSMSRNRLFTAINVVGLAISLSVGLLMLAFMAEIYSFDDFHTNGDRIYRVGNHFKYIGEDKDDFASTSVLAGKRIEAEVPGLEAMVLLTRGFGGDVQNGEKVITIQEGFWATPDFFSVFTFKLLKGNPATALVEPYSIVLTRETAEKLFGEDEALGQIVSINDEHNFSRGRGAAITPEEQFNDYTVTGVVENVPKNSHIQFESLASFATKEILEKENTNFLKWENMWSNYVYVLLQENQDPQVVQASFDAINEEEMAKNEFTKIATYLQPLGGIVPGEELNNSIGPTIEANIIWIITGLAFVVLISACFNYTNLSIARSLRRSKEVGIRKVVGASGGQVFGQFIFESVLIACLALVFAWFLFYLFLRPQFIGMNEDISQLVTLDPSFKIFLYFFGLAVFTGILAGFLPALFFSRIRAFSVLKDVSSLKLFKGMTIRKLLIVFQYTLSLGFIIAASVIYKQYEYSVGFNLGYKTDNILNIDLQKNDAELVKQELEKLPEVSASSFSTLVTSTGNYWSTTAKYKDPDDSTSVYYNIVDENYIPLHGHELVAGQNFIPQTKEAEESQLIVNEKFLKRFNIGEPSDAIGETIELNKKNLKIVGVVKDFHYGKLDSPVEEFAFRHLPSDYRMLNLHINPGNLLETREKIEAAWANVDKIHPLKARFYSEDIQKAYDFYYTMVKTIGFLAFLAIVIASMGLLGMVIFTTETRLKEISIRKVLGASERNLVYLLGRGFVLLLLVSALLAVPSTWYLIDTIFFEEVQYKVTPGFLDLFGGVMVVFGIAALAIGSQTVRAARANPAETLRNE